jgi:predicted glutamine amidotransferase
MLYLLFMCRMYALVGDYKSHSKDVFLSLQEVCIKDPFSKEVFGKTISHDDGWGYVNYNMNKGIEYFRSGEPVFKFNALQSDGKMLLVHARKSGKSGPFGVMQAHPYYRTSGKYDIYLIHNGFLDKSKFFGKIDNEYLMSHTDSELLLDKIISYSGSIAGKIERTLEYIYANDVMAGGLNLMILYINRENYENNILIYSDAKNFKLYHQLYFVEFPEFFGIFSSSILESKHFPEYKNKKILNRKVLYLLNENGLTEITS